MAKRFTDTTKWKRPWFRELGLHAKILWLYLCDECDHSGVWVADFDLASFQLGFKVDETKLKEWLGSKLVRLDKDKFFIPSYLEFQYGAKDNRFKAKQSALDLLAKFGLIDSQGLLKDLTDYYLSVTEQTPVCLSIGIGKGISNTGDARGGETSDLAAPSDFELVYQRYPKKVGKSDGLKKLKKLCPTKTLLADFERAMDAYVADCQKSEIFLKQFDTFVNSSWSDWLDPESGSSERRVTQDLSDIFGKEGA